MGEIIKLKWKGETYTLNEDEVFVACDAIEDVLTIGQLSEMLSDPSRIKFAKLAKCYAAMLKEAGARATAPEVHKEFLKVKANGNGEELRLVAMRATSTLIEVLMGGAPDMGEDKEPGNPQNSDLSDGPTQDRSKNTG